MNEDLKTIIENTVKDLVANFVYYDRKEDEELSMDDLNNAVKSGVITVDEMVSIFRIGLINTFNP